MRILYASDFFSPKVPDEHFRAEADAFARAGFSCSVLDTANLENTRPSPPLEPEAKVLYRGWMLNGDDYGRLIAVVEASGARPITNLATYLRTHHIPNWCEAIKEFTSETVVLPLGSNFEAELRALAWPSFFVKDFVKSLKTSMGSEIADPAQIGELMAEMEKFRGEIEGGLCVRRVERFEPGSEIRYFVVNGKGYSPRPGPVDGIVSEVIDRIDSPFYSVDVARRVDGINRVVEIGDGQVSDLVGWSVDRFVEVVASAA